MNQALKTNPSFDPSLLGNKRLSRPIRAGVLGLGRIGWLHHAATLSFHNGFTLQAVCDIDGQRVDEAMAASGCSGFTDYRKFLRQDDLELVVVASQSQDHERHSIQALKAEKHVLCEKPACRTTAGLDRMNRVAKEMNRLLIIHHNQRFYPDCVAIRDVIESGKLGKVFRIRRVVGSFKRRNDWQVLKKYNGGMLSNWGTHVIDQTLDLAGSPVKRVWSAARREFNPGDAEDDLKVVIECKNGVVLDLDVSSVDACLRPSWVVQGNRGTAWIQGHALHLRYLTGKIPKLEAMDGPKAKNRAYGIDGDKLCWKEEQSPVNALATCEGFYDNLYRAMRQSKPLLVSVESARQTYEVMDKIRREMERSKHSRASA